MASNSKDWIRSLTIASPVFLATLVSLIFVVTSIVSPVEAVNPGADLGGGGIPGGGGFGGGAGDEDAISITAQELWDAYASGNGDIYTSEQLLVTGLLGHWSQAGEPTITMVSDAAGGENLLFVFDYAFTDADTMDLLIGTPVTVLGTSRGLIGGIVILRTASSRDFDINDPDTLG